MRTAQRTQPLLELLETRSLFSVLNITNYGAVPNDNVNDRAAIQAAISASHAGDTILVPVGTFDITGAIKLYSGDKIQGAGSGAKLNFSDFGSENFGIEVTGQSQNVVIDGLTLRGNGGLINLPFFAKNVTVTNNDMSWGWNRSGYVKFAVSSPGGSDGLIIEHNYFHDALTSDRVIDLYVGSNTSYSYNMIERVNDGGHMQSMKRNVKMINNWARKIHRMGMEWQDGSGDNDSGDFLVQGNVFFDWEKPFNDTFAISIPTQRAYNVQVKNNFFKSDFTGGWGQPGGNEIQRFGICVEIGMRSGEVSGNTFGGPNPWATWVTSCTPNTLTKNNKGYGSTLWGNYAGEGGIYGNGSCIQQNNQQFPASQMPAVPTAASIGAGIQQVDVGRGDRSLQPVS